MRRRLHLGTPTILRSGSGQETRRVRRRADPHRRPSPLGPPALAPGNPANPARQGLRIPDLSGDPGDGRGTGGLQAATRTRSVTHLSRLDRAWLEEPRPPPPPPEPPPPPLPPPEPPPPPPPPKPEESRFPDSSFSTAGRCPVRAASSSSCSFPIPRAAAPWTPFPGPPPSPFRLPNFPSPGNAPPEPAGDTTPLPPPCPSGARHFRDPASRVTAPPRPAPVPT